MGAVYKARDHRLDRLVAIKVLSQKAAATPERQARFIQEAKTASALNHPHIVTIYDIDLAGDPDIFSFGVMLYEVLTWRAGFRVDNGCENWLKGCLLSWIAFGCGVSAKIRRCASRPWRI